VLTWAIEIATGATPAVDRYRDRERREDDDRDQDRDDR
jgi:hypothetical protein